MGSIKLTENDNIMSTCHHVCVLCEHGRVSVGVSCNVVTCDVCVCGTLHYCI